MKHLLGILAIVLLFASCSSTHKIKTETKKTVDSVVTAHKDSSTVSKAQTYNDNFVAKGVDVTFDYGNDSTDVVQNDTTSKGTETPTDQDVNDIKTIVTHMAARSGLNGKIPATITIHIDSLSNQTSITTTKDSTKVSTDTHSKINSTETTKNKTVTRTGMSGWMVPVFGILIFLILVFVALKIKKVI